MWNGEQVRERLGPEKTDALALCNLEQAIIVWRGDRRASSSNFQSHYLSVQLPKWFKGCKRWVTKFLLSWFSLWISPPKNRADDSDNDAPMVSCHNYVMRPWVTKYRSLPPQFQKHSKRGSELPSEHVAMIYQSIQLVDMPESSPHDDSWWQMFHTAEASFMFQKWLWETHSWMLSGIFRFCLKIPLHASAKTIFLNEISNACCSSWLMPSSCSSSFQSSNWHG